MSTIPSNVTTEEFFQYYCKDEDAVRFYEQQVEQLQDDSKEIEYANKRIERVEEQLYFATELIVSLQETLKSCSRMTEFKKYFEQQLSDSYVELQKDLRMRKQLIEFSIVEQSEVTGNFTVIPNCSDEVYSVSVVSYNESIGTLKMNNNVLIPWSGGMDLTYLIQYYSELGYELRHFCNLAIDCNSNILEILFTNKAKDINQKFKRMNRIKEE